MQSQGNYIKNKLNRLSTKKAQFIFKTSTILGQLMAEKYESNS